MRWRSRSASDEEAPGGSAGRVYERSRTAPGASRLAAVLLHQAADHRVGGLLTAVVAQQAEAVLAVGRVAAAVAELEDGDQPDLPVAAVDRSVEDLLQVFLLG